MPRRSSASLTFLRPGVDGRPTRLRPSNDLTGPEREVFTAIVGALPPEHFKESDRWVLEEYVRDVVLARDAAGQMREAGVVIDGRASPWVAIRAKATRSMAILATRLRLTPASRLDAKSVARRASPPMSYFERERLEECDDDA